MSRPPTSSASSQADPAGLHPSSGRIHVAVSAASLDDNRAAHAGMAADGTVKEIDARNRSNEGFGAMIGQHAKAIGRARPASLMRQQRTFELMRLATLIDDPQANRPLSRQMHLGGRKAKIVCHDVDHLLGRIARYRGQRQKRDGACPAHGETLGMCHGGMRWPLGTGAG